MVSNEKLFNIVTGVDKLKLLFNIKNKKYLIKIFLLTSVTTSLLVSIFSTIIYYNVKNSVEENIHNSNRQIFEQIRYNILFIDDMMKNMCLSAYYNTDAQYIMNTPNSDSNVFNLVRSIEKIRSNFVSINPQIHSIYIYNNLDKKYYGTYSGMLFQDETISQLIKKMKVIPIKKPVYRKFRTIFDTPENKYEDVISYFMYENSDQFGDMDGGVVINIKARWIIDNIKKINMVNRNNDEEIFIITDDGSILKDRQSRLQYSSLIDLNNRLIFEAIEDVKDFGFKKIKIDNNHYFISVMYLDSIRWKIIKIQHQGNVFNVISNIQASIVMITIVFLLIAIIMSISISNNIYNPISKLVKLAEPLSKGKQKYPVNEITVIQEAIIDLEQYTKKYILHENANSNKLKDNFLRQLILDSTSFTIEELKNAYESELIKIDISKNYCVCVLNIDDFNTFNEDNKDKQIIKFAISNIANEVLSERFQNQIVDIQQQQMAVLLSVEENESTVFQDVFMLLKTAQSYVIKYFNVNFTASISPVAKDHSQITNMYLLAASNINYKYALGKGAVITPLKVKKNEENTEMLYPGSYEKKLEESIKACNLELFEDTVCQIFINISRQHYSNMLLSMIRLISTVRKSIVELCNAQVSPIDINFNKITQDFFDIETMDEVYFRLINTVSHVFAQIENISNNNKYFYIVETIKQIINQKYMQQSLCLQEIADNLKMSSNYVGRIFKENMGISVAQYINQVRIEMAAKWLDSSDLSVKEIMYKVGIESEAHFYRHFKNQFGVTPKEYSLKRVIKK